MNEPLAGEWRSLLKDLQERLEDLARGGAGWFNVPRDEVLATLPEAPGGEEGAGEGKGAREKFRAMAGGLDAAPVGEGGREQAPAEESPRIASPESGREPGAESSPAEPDSAPASLESLRFQYRECNNCKLSESRTRLVFGTGHGAPRLLFVGEGPGAEEDQQGLPFVGRAGILLTGFIEAMGLTREDVYIANIVKCRPPGNRNPAPEEIASCAPILQRQIELLDPAVIVALGNVPLKHFQPRAAGITRERGRLFQYQQWRVLPTFHPSYLLRNPAAIPACWEDFRQALELAYPGD